MGKISKKSGHFRKKRYKFEHGKYCIELQIQNEKQLFDYRDPAPFREKDLDEDATNYIVSSAKEFALSDPLRLIIHIGRAEEDRRLDNDGLIEAIRLHFDYEAELAHKNIRFRLRQGQLALATGLCVLTSCLFLADFLAKSFPQHFVGHTLSTGLTISSWVSMWYPLNIFLYEWWPLEFNKRIFRKLSKMEIQIK